MYKLLVKALLMFALITSSLCDDGYVRAVGGTVELLEDHASIRMLSEIVNVKLYADRAVVDCRFEFKNEGGDTTVLIGFPEQGGGTDFTMDSEHKHLGVKNFRAFLDGKRVKHVVYGTRFSDSDYYRWYVRKVKFKKGQTRVSRVTYTAELGYLSDGSRFFNYILHTGSSWKGPIGRAEINVELVDLIHSSDWSISPPNYQVKGNRLQWLFHDFQPTQEDDITLYGHLYYRPAVKLIPHNSSYEESIRKGGFRIVKGETFINIDQLNAILWKTNPLKVQASSTNPKKFIIRSNQTVFQLTVGVRTAIVNNNSMPLKTAPFLAKIPGNDDSLFVPLRFVMKQLGYRVEWKREMITRPPHIQDTLYIILSEGTEVTASK